MIKDLVTILTPAYNSETLIPRLLNSVLKQTYAHISMLVVNDGSTDKTEEVVSSYIPKFEERGYSLKIINQKNSGQSVAINNGLKYVEGEFLIWPDSDDYFRKPYSISKLVEVLSQKSSEFGVIRCIPTYINEVDGSEKVCNYLNSELTKENQFENCLYSRNFFWGAGDYMVRMEAFDTSNPTRNIYVEKNAGQNWQMLLPILYSYKCITLEESLFNILERANSHSRGQYSTFDQQVSKYSSYCNTLIHTLNAIAVMPVEEKMEYQQNIIEKYKGIELELAIRFTRYKAERKILKELKTFGKSPSKIHLICLHLKYSCLGRIVSKIRKFLILKLCSYR